MRVSCVAPVGGVSVEAEARTGEVRKHDQPFTSQIKPTAKGPTAHAIDFLDGIDPQQTSRFNAPAPIQSFGNRPFRETGCSGPEPTR